MTDYGMMSLAEHTNEGSTVCARTVADAYRITVPALAPNAAQAMQRHLRYFMPMPIVRPCEKQLMELVTR